MRKILIAIAFLTIAFARAAQLNDIAQSGCRAYVVANRPALPEWRWRAQVLAYGPRIVARDTHVVAHQPRFVAREPRLLAQ